MMQCAAGDASGGQVGERVGGDVGADGGLEGGRSAQRVVDRCGQGRRRRGLRGAVLEVHAQFGEDVVGVGQDIHKVGDRRTLVAGYVRHARLQQGLGHGQDPLAVEHLALAQAQLLHFLLEGSLCHIVFRPCFEFSGPAGPPRFTPSRLCRRDSMTHAPRIEPMNRRLLRSLSPRGRGPGRGGVGWHVLTLSPALSRRGRGGRCPRSARDVHG